MEPAATIVRNLGGPTAVALYLGLHRTRVSNWSRPKESGGTGGIIPQKHIPALLILADQIGVALALGDFFTADAAA
jgi:hypothetical protein